MTTVLCNEWGPGPASWGAADGNGGPGFIRDGAPSASQLDSHRRRNGLLHGPDSTDFFCADACGDRAPAVASLALRRSRDVCRREDDEWPPASAAESFASKEALLGSRLSRSR
jgi:hypothetical protein